MSTTPSRTRLAIVLGLLTAIGPFAIDMYLPALPSMEAALRASPQALQASLMAFYLALGAGQLLAGPLSDALGRKRPLYAGLALYTLAGLGCAFAPSAETLVALRLLQGLGACFAMVTPRAVVRDLHTGADAARLMTLLMTIYAVSPILAPLAGSFVAGSAGWRGVFVVLAGAGMVGLAMVAWMLPETRLPSQRMGVGLLRVGSAYARLVRDGSFMVPALTASLTLAGFYLYVAGAPFVMTRHYGVTPRQFALLFALNAVPYVLVAQANGWLTRRFGLRSVVRAGVAGQLVVAAGLWGLVALGLDSLLLVQAGTMLVFAFTGILLPTLFVLAMEEQAAFAGSASALIGTLNFGGGALAMALAAPHSDGTPGAMLGGIAITTAAAFLVGMRLRTKGAGSAKPGATRAA